MRRPRLDAPDTWHHVMNRGIARRTIFETDADRRFFLSLLAREARRGRLEVHAFCLMLTHFHLLVRSVTGELSEAMRRIQNRYVRWFNRTRQRDGPLLRGRFLSRPIDTLRYRRSVVTYIHDNAVAAGLVANPVDDPWCSATWYGREDRPRWLTTDWVDSVIAVRGGGGDPAAALAVAFPSRVEEDFRAWVERQLSARLSAELAAEEERALKYAGSPRVVAWAMRKAELADGTRPWRPFSAPPAVEQALTRARARIGPLAGLFARRAKDAWIVLRAGLLRLLSGCTHREIALRVGRHAATISRDVRDHLALLRSDTGYEAITATLAHEILKAAP